MTQDQDQPGADGAEIRLRALRGCRLFSGLEPETLAGLSSAMQPMRWSQGALIFSRGDPGDLLLAITRGRIRLSLASPQGREIALTTLGPGDVLGEMAVLDGQPRSADATALADTSCLTLTRPRFEELARRHADLGLALARHLAAHLRQTNFQMESIALYDLQARLVRFLLHALARAPGKGTERRLRLDLHQGEIAAILGASRPKINLAFGALTQSGAIRREGSMLVCDVEMLSRLSEGEPPRA